MNKRKRGDSALASDFWMAQKLTEKARKKCEKAYNSQVFEPGNPIASLEQIGRYAVQYIDEHNGTKFLALGNKKIIREALES